MDKFYILANAQKDENLRITEEIENYLKQQGKQVKVDTSEVISVKNIPKDTQCILVLGGDGTLIRAAREVLHTKIPLLGVNLGTLGYLTEVEKTQIIPALDKLIQDDYMIEERMMLKGTTPPHAKNALESLAFNDVVITRSGELRIVEYKIYVNGEYLHSYKADGILVATPTGSTGYNLSAGGPIVKPSASSILITPICPHTLNTRSIVLSGEDHVMVEIGPGRKCENEQANVVFDADTAFSLNSGQAVHICKADTSVRMIKLSNISFLEALRRKLGE